MLEPGWNQLLHNVSSVKGKTQEILIFYTFLNVSAQSKGQGTQCKTHTHLLCFKGVESAQDHKGDAQLPEWRDLKFLPPERQNDSSGSTCVWNITALRYSDGFLSHKDWASPSFLCYNPLSCILGRGGWFPKRAGPPRVCCALLCPDTPCPCPCLSSPEFVWAVGAAQPTSGHWSAWRGQEEFCLSSLRPKAHKHFGLKILPLFIQGCPRELFHPSTVFRARKRRNWFHVIMPFSSSHMGTIRNHILLSSP